MNYRINCSKILLRTENISVGEIAGRTGFADVSNFIIQFKKQTGQKPMDYRKRFA
ncbi:MAG: helix-turn-helix domain-containing protein [Hominilimicola sp.]